MSQGSVLYLLPSLLADVPAGDVLPAATLRVARHCTYFLVENAKSARAFLKAIDHPQPMATLRIVEIGHAPDPSQIDTWLSPLRSPGLDAAVVSEAGCPGVADPGASLVGRAHQLGIAVRPLVGPSSLLLALMAAGLDGQAFRFVGYLPQDAGACAHAIKALERKSAGRETQLFIETPYRTARLFELLLEHAAATTLLALALDLTAATEECQARTIAQWRALDASERPLMVRRPCVFALRSAAPR